MQEEWKDVIGYEGLYQVSNFGNVKTLKYGKEKILKPGKNSHGYLQVNLYKNGKLETCKVHRLVALAFMGLPIDEDYYSVNHIDENKTNNKLENLQYCTHEYNNNYGSRIEKTRKALINYPKFSKPVIGINLINGLIVEFPSTCEAERVMNIKRSNICQCCKGKRKSAGGYRWFYANQEEENKNV